MWAPVPLLLLGGIASAGALQAGSPASTSDGSPASVSGSPADSTPGVPLPRRWPPSARRYVHAAAGPLEPRAARAQSFASPPSFFNLMKHMKPVPCNRPSMLDSGVEFEQLVRDDDGAYLFVKEPLMPVHIYYRFSGHSRHDTEGGHTPVLSITSFLNTLQNTSRAQRGSTNVYILLNGPAGLGHRVWISKMLGKLGLESYTLLDAPTGNLPSYNFMVEQVRELRDTPEAMVLFLEEDYLLHPEALAMMVEFWSLYKPCSAVPYEDPEYYVHRKLKTNPGMKKHTTVLRTPGFRWRTVQWSTCTIALRLDFFHHLHMKALLPTPPSSDANSSSKWSRRYGIWAPVPTLASHVHLDTFTSKIHEQSFDPDFDYITYMKELEEEAAALGYDAPHAS